MRTIKDLIVKLDIHPPNENARIHVYRLKNAMAGEIVQVLNGLLGGGGAPSTLSPVTGRNSLGRGGSGGIGGGGSLNSGFGGGMGGGFGGSSGGYGSSGGFGSSASFGGAGSNSASGGSMGGSSMGGGRGNSTAESFTASTGGSGSKSPDFEMPVSVTADPATNSLIVSASPQDYQTLHRVIEQLDVPRIQVFVQAIIVEVSAQRARDIGVNFQSATNISGSTIGVGQPNFGQLQNALANPLGLTGLGIGLASGSKCTIASAVSAATSVATAGATPATTTVPCDVALLTALETDTHSNVLSAPTLLTADNEEAMIVVGQNLPFVGSASATSALSGQIFNSVDRQNVGITLDIIPQVSEGDYVRLDVYEEVSNVVSGTTNQTTNPLGPDHHYSLGFHHGDGPGSSHRRHRRIAFQRERRPALCGSVHLGHPGDRQPVQRQRQQQAETQPPGILTPHVIRTREDLRSLALDERQKFADALGRRELHQMPMEQYKQLYKPTFSVPVSPAQDLKDHSSMMAPSAGDGGPASGFGSSPSSMVAPSSSSSTPLNTEEIGPSSSRGAVKPAPWMTAPATPSTSSPSTTGSAAPAAPAAALAAVPADGTADAR